MRVLDTQGRAETIVHGRYVLPGGALSRDPLGGPVLNCTTATTYTARRSSGAQRSSGQRPPGDARRRWMSLSGLPQRVPDRDTRGYFDARGRRVWLDVYQ